MFERKHISPEGTRRRKKSRLFDIVLVPVGEGAHPRTLRASRMKLGLIGAAAFLLCLFVAFVVLVYTPFALFVPIPNPALERRYGEQMVGLQQQLGQLEQDVNLLKDYNHQLRKALGEGSSGDSTTTSGGPSVAVDGGEPAPLERESQRSSPAQQPSAQQEAPSLDEGPGGVDIGGSLAYSSVVTSSEAGRATFPLMLPVDGVVSQGFDPLRSHFGVDFAGKRGTPVCAAADGHVVFAGWTYDDGNMLIIAHDGGYLTVYKHNQMLLTTVQTVVRRGESVALLGDSGRTSSGPHLHFELWKDGMPRDPNQYLLTPGKVQ